MSLESRHFIGGIEIRPKNADDIGVKLDWTGDAKEAELTVDSLVLENMGKKLVLDHIAQYGIFEGLPYTFQINTLSLQYFIELVDNPKISGVGDSSIEVNIKKRFGISHFYDKANPLSFEAINKTNPISTIDIPYLIIRDNQAEMLIMLGISAYTLTKALIEGVKELVTAVTDFIKIISVGLVVNIGQIISAALLLIARIIYVVALIIALIDITKQIIEIIFPPIRKFKASTILELCQKGCATIGMTFSSTIIEGMPQETILPAPLQKGNQNIFNNIFSFDTGYYTKGYPTNRDTVKTFGDLIQALRAKYNAEIRIIGTTLYLERRDYWELNSGLQITSTLNLQNTRENEHGYNSDEWWKRYYLHGLYDTSDTHTMDKLDALDCEYSTEPVTVNNKDLVNINGLVEVIIPFAYGTRKDELTWVEKQAAKFAKIADDVVQFFGGDSSLEAKIKGRVGVLQISQQYFSVTKLLYQVGGKQPANYLSFIGANPTYIKYHAINQVRENFKRIQSETIPFSTAQFEELLTNNYVYDQNENSLEIRTFEWVNETKLAEIQYAVRSNEGFNTKTILIDA